MHFSSNVSVNFPPSDISEITPPSENGAPAKMNVNFMGLAGVNGPLPQPYTETILERTWYGDNAFKDFLDIFNHRLISLLYRVRKIHRLGFEPKYPENTNFAYYLFCLFGLGSKGLRDRMKIKDRSLLYYAAILSQQPHSMTALEHIISDYFKVKVKCVPFCGQWIRIDEDQITKLGETEKNQILGESAVLGNRVWDQESKFEIHIGPLTIEEFLDFLPIGSGFLPLCQIIRFFTGLVFDFDIILLLKGREVPQSRLSLKGNTRLGWTSWIWSEGFKTEYGSVRLSPNQFK